MTRGDINWTGRNIRFVENEIRSNNIFKVKVDSKEKEHKVFETAETNLWKIEFLQEVVNVL